MIKTKVKIISKTTRYRKIKISMNQKILKIKIAKKNGFSWALMSLDLFDTFLSNEAGK